MIDIGEMLRAVKPPWAVAQPAYRPDEEGDWETRFCLANGCAGVRGCLPLASPGRTPGTFVAGVFDKPDDPDTAGVFGLTLRNKAVTPSYAVAPVWNLLEIAVDGEPLDFLNAEPVAFARTLDMERGLLIEEYSLRDRRGRTTAVRQLAAMSLADRRLWLGCAEIEARDYRGRAVVRFPLRLQTTPGYLPRLRDYTSRTALEDRGGRGGAAFLLARVSETGTRIAVASATRSEAAADLEIREDGVAERSAVELAPGRAARFERLVALQTGRDPGEPADGAAARLAGARQRGLEACLDDHRARLAERWRDAEVGFEGDDEALRGVRWCTYHLIQMGNADDPDVSIGATGLHGNGYFGHAFWDTEIFLLPFYLATDPPAAEALLAYRSRRLGAARTNASRAGLPGAKYPWTSTATGLDVTPPDWQRCADRQIHISADVAYAFRQHRRWTGDWDFFRDHGLEVTVATAVYYAAKATRGDDGRWHFPDVLGPDEYHLHADDNYFTNHLVRWNLTAAVEGMEECARRDPGRFRDIAGRTGWDEALRDRLLEVARRMAFPETRDGVCEQYAGFFALPDPPPFERGRYGMPVLGEHFYDTETQASKQADAVMMHYLFPDDFPADVVRASFEYYDRRCTQASSLSPSVHSVVGLRAGLDEHAYDYFRITALLDLENLHRDRNLAEGIHAACAGGTWTAAVYGFGGASVRGDALRLDPRLPPRWRSMRYALRFRGRRLVVEVRPESCTVTLEGEPLEVEVWGRAVRVPAGAPTTVERGPS